MTPYQACEICLKENKRKPELEPIILNDPWACYLYAKDVIKGRWLEAEPIILTDPCHSYWYALNIIKGRWNEAEPIIQTNSHHAFWYTIDVMKTRWLKAEPIIKQNKCYWKNYCLHFNIKKNKINWKVGL